MKTSYKIVILENTYYTVLSLRMEILRHFKALGHEVYVLSKSEKNEVELLESEGFHCRPVGSVVYQPWKAVLYLYHLVSEIRNIQPDIIFSFTIRPNLFGSLAARFLHIPIVCNVTGTGPLTTDTGPVYTLIRWAHKHAFRKNQRVFFQNSDDYDYFLKNNFVAETHAKLLPGSGVDTEFYSPRPKNTAAFKFLMISRLVIDKGVRDFIEAAKIIRSQYPEVCFQLLGPFWQQSLAKNTISKEEVEYWTNQSWVQYLGYTLDVRPYIAEVDCIVLPSYREGCANVLMQGAAMGKPLIASDVTGCRNLIDNGISGFLCRPRDPQDLAEKMIRLYRMNNEERQRMGHSGREKMMANYQKKLVLEAYLYELSCI